MWYAILAEDVNSSLEKRTAARPAHLKRLADLQEQGRLLLAGPHPTIDTEAPGPAGFSGSLIIAEFDSLNDAQNWARADPYAAAGVYSRTIVKPFIKVLP